MHLSIRSLFFFLAIPLSGVACADSGEGSMALENSANAASVSAPSSATSYLFETTGVYDTKHNTIPDPWDLPWDDSLFGAESREAHYMVTFSNNNTVVHVSSIGNSNGGLEAEVDGHLVRSQGTTLTFELERFAGGQLFVNGLSTKEPHGQIVKYGSGRPVLLAERGELVAAPHQ